MFIPSNISVANDSKMGKIIAHIRESDGDEQTLDEHLLNVAELCRDNAAKFGFADIGELLGIVHDIGKYRKIFQDYIKLPDGRKDQDADDIKNAPSSTKKTLKGKIDHSTSGAQLLWREFAKTKRTVASMLIMQILPLLLASHHSGMIDCIAPNGEDVFSKRIKKTDDLTGLSEVEQTISPDILGKIENLICAVNNSQEQLRSMVLSFGRNGRNILDFKLGFLARMLFSCLIDADRTDTIDFEKYGASKLRQRGKYVEWHVLAERLENHIASFKGDDPVSVGRKKISDYCMEASRRERGIFTLTVPTGGGKTLASLRFALNHAQNNESEPDRRFDRVFYIVPYTSIIDQNAEVARKVLEKEYEEGRIVLECHSNLSSERQSWKGKILSENWDAPVVFTTSVQFLEAMFEGGTRSVRRLHQLARSIIVFDEIQTLPIRVVHMFCNALNFLVEHCGTTVVLCTATQPLLYDVEKKLGALDYSAANEIIPDVSSLFCDFNRVAFFNMCRPGGFSNKEIAELTVEEQKRSNTVLLVVNTTKVAREVYRYVARRFEYTVHLSAKMCCAHRATILEKIRESLDLKPQRPLICISTQVIEAGVDVDFGAGIRCLAGLDSAAQTAGRINRHGFRSIGRLLLINSCDERVDLIDEIKEGAGATMRLLDERRDLLDNNEGWQIDPELITRYFDEYFYRRADSMIYPTGKGAERSDSLLNMLSSNSFAVEENKKRQPDNVADFPLKQSFATAGELFRAIDAPVKSIIVPFQQGEELVAELCRSLNSIERIKLLRKAQKYAINIYPNEFKKLCEERAIYEINLEGQEESGLWALRSEYYDEAVGLCLERAAKMKTEVISHNE